MQSIKELYDEYIQHIEDTSHGCFKPLPAAILVLATVLNKENKNGN